MNSKIHKDIRVFRFKAALIKHRPFSEAEFRADGPVPIHSDNGRLIGFASILDGNHMAVAVCAMDPSNPERLDLETGSHRYWLDATLECRAFLPIPGRAFLPTVVYIKSLILTLNPIEGQEPIDGSLAEVS